MVLFSPRTSPSGQEAPIAVLKLSGDVAFSDGVAITLPFNTLAFSKGDAGHILNPAVDGIVFAGGPGLWFAQVVIDLDTNVDRAQGVVGASTGTRNINLVSDQANTGHLGSLLFGGHMLIPASDTPLHTTDPVIFCGFGVGFEGFGASGHILAASTTCALWPMYGFDV